MTFLPIVERELRVAARRPLTYRSRQITVLVALVLTGWTLLITRRWATSTRIGEDLFQTLGTFAFVYCLLAGLRTADALSQEKREGTLGLLFLTDLKGHDVLLGKLVSHSLHFVYGLVAALPVLSLPLLIGGVTWSDFGRMALVLINTLLFSLALGLWVSARSYQATKALAGTILAIALFAGGLPWLGEEWKDATNARKTHPAFYWPSPGYNFIQVAWSVGRATPAREFWQSWLTVHGLTWFFLVWTAFKLPRAWQDRTLSARAETWQARAERWSQGNPATRFSHRRRTLEKNPVLWLDDRQRLQKTAVWLFLSIFAMVWLWHFSENPRRWFSPPIVIFTGLIWHGVLKTWLAVQAARRLSEDRRSGALELLLVTPLTVREIVEGQRRALLRQFGLPILAVLIADLLLMWGQYHLHLWRNPWGLHQRQLWLLTCGAGIVMLLADVHTLSWLGPWLGLSTRNLFQAAFVGVGLVLILPWALYGGTIAITLWIAPRVILRETFLTLFWFGLGITVDGICLAWARSKILREFRQTASGQLGHVAKGDRWGKLHVRQQAITG